MATIYTLSGKGQTLKGSCRKGCPGNTVSCMGRAYDFRHVSGLDFFHLPCHWRGVWVEQIEEHRSEHRCDPYLLEGRPP